MFFSTFCLSLMHKCVPHSRFLCFRSTKIFSLCTRNARCRQKTFIFRPKLNFKIFVISFASHSRDHLKCENASPPFSVPRLDADFHISDSQNVDKARQCRDDYFSYFCPFSATKFSFFLKNNVGIIFVCLNSCNFRRKHSENHNIYTRSPKCQQLQLHFIRLTLARQPTAGVCKMIANVCRALGD
jgi:hypothetical protein